MSDSQSWIVTCEQKMQELQVHERMDSNISGETTTDLLMDVGRMDVVIL